MRTDKFNRQNHQPDSYFKQLSGQFKDNLIDGLFLFNLRVSSQLALILDSSKPKSAQREPVRSFLSRQLDRISKLEELSLCKEMADFEGYYIRPMVVLDDYEQLNGDVEQASDNSDADFYAVHDNFDNEAATDVQRPASELPDTLREFLLRNEYNYHNRPNPSDWAGFEYYEQSKSAPKNGGKKKKSQKKDSLKVNLQHITDYETRQLNPILLRDLTLPDPIKHDWRLQNCLPKDYRVCFDSLTRMFSRPQTQIKRLFEEHASVIIENLPEDLPDDVHNFSDLYAQPGTVEITEEDRRKESKSWRQSNYVDMKKVRQKVKQIALVKGNFMEVIDCLPQLLDETERSRISYSLCFVTLMHLPEKERKLYLEMLFESLNPLDFMIVRDAA